MKFEVMVAVIVGIVIRRVWCCCEGGQKVEFDYKGERGVKEVEIEFKKVIDVCCVVIEVHVIPKWIDVYIEEYGMVKRVWFNESGNDNVKVIRFDKMKPVVVTKGMRFVVSNNDMLVIKEICVYTKKYQYAVVSYVSSDDGNVKCLYMNHSRNEIDSDDCGSLCLNLNVLPYDMLFIVDTNENEIRNYDNTKVISLKDDKGNCTVHNDSTIICVDSINNNNRLRVHNIQTVNISNLYKTDNNDIVMFNNYTANQLQLYLTKFRYIYKTFPIVVEYYTNNINKYKIKSQAILTKINQIQVNNTIKGTKLYPISNCNELYQQKNGWYYFNINDINIQLYCDFTSILNNPISIYIGNANNHKCSTLHMKQLETVNNSIINLIINEILSNKSTHFPMKEHFDILLLTPHKGIIRTHKNEYILTDINTYNPNRIKYILCTTTSSL